MGSVGTEQPVTTQNRWFVVLAAVVLNLTLGALYSWPVFANFLEVSLPEAERWRSVASQLVFSMATAFLAVGVIVAGQLSEKHEPRTLILLSAIFTGGGYVAGGLLPLHPIPVTITIGVMVGFGIGMAYALPISLAARWFPDRKGLVTGLAMAGFGLGSVLWSQAFDLLLAERIGISLTFIIYGLLFSGLILVTIRFLRNPPEGYAESLARSGSSDRSENTSGRLIAPENLVDFRRSEIIRQRQLYYLFYTLLVGSAIGLMIIGMSKTYPIERLVAAGYSMRVATNITRMGALILFPIFNGSGRIVFGWLSDRLGWKPVIVLSYAIQAAILFFFPWLMSMPLTAYLAFPLLAMCYGGNFTIFPIATGQIWGSEHLAANYSLVFLAFGIGALIGPSLGGITRDAGSINTAFIIASMLLAAGALLVGILRRPHKRE